jgi:outer membrane protein OmpA-like peptidoglycan-associated protein/3,4-dihydroxy-2-butanone 4-phosphate synthase
MKKVLQLLLFLIFNFLAAQEGTYEILNTSINSKFAELGVTYSGNNSVIFASSKKDNSGRRTNNRQLSLELYHGMITENGDIIQTDKFSSEINNKFFESDIAFTPDFKTIYFTWNNFYSALKSKDSAKWKTLYLFKASVNQNFEISNVAPMPFNSKEYSVRSPAVSADGKKLYFVSDMPGGYGELDIYVVDINSDGNYGTPKNLGSAVNTKQTELFPYIDQNNTLYFSSNGYKGLGGLDIFKSEFINGNFQQAVNLPPPFNSKYDDFALVIDATNSGYFTSNRAGGKGDVDIYAFKEKCIQTINILTLNDANDQPLDQVQVFLFLNNQLVEKQTVSKGSGYKFNINCKETYKIIAEKENYKTAELTIATDDKNKTEITKTLKLTSIECKQLLSGNILDGKTNLPLDQVQVSLFQNNQLVEKQSISKGSNFKFNVNCKETYKIIAEKENYKTAELTIATDDKNKTEITKTLKLTSIECKQLLSGNILDLKTNLPLDQVQVSFFQNNKLVEKQSISKGSNFKFNINCKETYKLVAEKENYETVELSVSSNDKNKTEITKTLKLTPIECTQLLSGNITDSKTNLPLDQVSVSLFQNNQLVEKQTISKNSNFKFNVDCKETYKLVAEKENYETVELSITTDDKNKTETRKTLKLTPIECIQMLNGIVTDSETNLPLPNAVVHIYKGKELLAKINLDDNAAFNFKLECEMPYRFTVSLKNYHDLVSTIKTTDKTNEVNNIQLQMESSIEFVEVREQKMIKTKAINFDLDQSSIRLDAAIELNKVIAILRKYPKLKIEIKSHTDSRAAAEYNMKLTNDRAKKVMDYLIANGIDSSRVSGRGYGETQLLNNCAKGVKCSEEEHQMNRRTEFIITDE